MENKTLASEMLHEIKATSKRWFIAFLVTLSLWFATIIGFVLYEYYTIPVDETTIEQESDNQSTNLVIGGDYNGEAEDNPQTER